MTQKSPCWYCWNSVSLYDHVVFCEQPFHPDCLDIFKKIHPSDKPRSKPVITDPSRFLLKFLWRNRGEANKLIISPFLMSQKLHKKPESLAYNLRELREQKAIDFKSVPTNEKTNMVIQILAHPHDCGVLFNEPRKKNHGN